MNTQLVFELPVLSGQNQADFLVSDCNTLAAKWLGQWPDWPNRRSVIYGPRASGKSHLAHIWRSQTSAKVLDLTKHKSVSLFSEILENQAYLIDDAWDENGELSIDSEELLHIFNYIFEKDSSLLILARTSPMEVKTSLRDLQSRLKAMTAVEISQPDDALLAALLVKHFHDRQLNVPANVIAFLLRRIHRSFAAIEDIVKQIDQAALARKQKITVPFVRSILNSQTIE